MYTRHLCEKGDLYELLDLWPSRLFLMLRDESVHVLGLFCHTCLWCSLWRSGVSISWQLFGECQQCLVTQCVQTLGSSVYIKLESMSGLLFSSSQLQHRVEHPGDTQKPWQQSGTCHRHECGGCPDSGVERLRNSIARHLGDDVILIWGFTGRSAAATDASLALSLSGCCPRSLAGDPRLEVAGSRGEGKKWHEKAGPRAEKRSADDISLAAWC